MDETERIAPDKPLQRFDAQREFADRESALRVEAPLAQPLQVLRLGVFGTVNNPQVVAPTHFDRQLDRSFRSTCQELQRFYDHPLPAGASVSQPPAHGRFDGLLTR